MTGKELTKPIEHESPVWAVGFSPDEKTIATGSQDSTLQLWDLSISGDTADLKKHTSLRITDGPIWWIKFKQSRDGVILGIAGQDKTVRIFNMSCLKSLFSDLQKLEKEGEQQGGLMIGEGPTGERQIVPVPNEQFVPKQVEPDLQASFQRP